LPLEHPAGIFGGQRAHLIESVELHAGKIDLGGGDVV
jgi:hypothetical protein